MKKILTVLMMFALLAACLTTAFAEEATDKDGNGVITIGVTFPVTDEPLAANSAVYGIEIAVDEINEAGGILGMPVEMIVEDMGLNPDTALNAVNKLIARGDVDAIIGLNYSTCALACESTINEAGIPAMIGASSPKLAEIENAYIFRVRCSDTFMTKIALSYLMDTGAIAEGSKLGVLYNNNDFGIGGYEEIEEACAAQNIELFGEAYNSSDSDCSGQVLKLIGNEIDALIVWSDAPSVPVAARAITELGVSCPIIGSAPCAQNSVLSTCPDWVNGWYTVADVCLSSTEEDILEFFDKWDALHSRDELTFDAPIYYSATYLLADAFERAGSADTQALIDALNATEGVEGLTGTYSKFDNIEMLSNAAIQQIVDGELVFIGTADGRNI